MFTLQNIISKRIKGPDGNWERKEITLTAEQGNAFIRIFSKGCRPKTRTALMRAVKDNFSRLRSNGILERVIFDDHVPCELVARQDYGFDLVEVRSFIMKYY